MGFVQGEQRSQGALFPVSVDELIPEDHRVRVIDLVGGSGGSCAAGLYPGCAEGDGASAL